MNISKWLSPIVVFSIFGQGAQAFDNSSLTGCYASSLYGNILGPQITVDAEGNLVPDFQTLVLHGTAAVGRVCFDGAGNVTEINATQNIAGVCAIPYSGTGTYTVLADGTGSSSLSTTIPADAVLAPGCALFDAQGESQVTRPRLRSPPS